MEVEAPCGGAMEVVAPCGGAIEAVDDELATLFLQYLSGKELGTLSCCSKRWLRLTGTAELWRNALAREFGGACRCTRTLDAFHLSACVLTSSSPSGMVRRLVIHAGVGQDLQLRAERIDVVRRSSSSSTCPATEVDEEASAAAPPLPAADTVDALRRRYQLTAAIAAPADTPTPVCWRRLRMDNALRAQEGHSAALLDDRWMIVVGGSPCPLYLLSLHRAHVHNHTDWGRPGTV